MEKKKRKSVVCLEKAARDFGGTAIVSLKVAVDALNIEREEIIGNISKTFNDFLESVL